MDITIPFPGRSFIDVTREMREQGYTPQIMFQIAEEFFLSINMTALPTDFWLESILERPPPERQLLCQPSAWDFCNRNTYRWVFALSIFLCVIKWSTTSNNWNANFAFNCFETNSFNLWNFHFQHKNVHECQSERFDHGSSWDDACSVFFKLSSSAKSFSRWGKCRWEKNNNNKLLLNTPFYCALFFPYTSESISYNIFACFPLIWLRNEKYAHNYNYYYACEPAQQGFMTDIVFPTFIINAEKMKKKAIRMQFEFKWFSIRHRSPKLWA